MRALYVGLITITFGSVALYLAGALFDVGIWSDFVTGYTLVLVAYTCYLFALLFVHDLRPRRYPSYAGGKIAVLIPVSTRSRIWLSGRFAQSSRPRARSR